MWKNYLPTCHFHIIVVSFHTGTTKKKKKIEKSRSIVIQFFLVYLHKTGCAKRIQASHKTISQLKLIRCGRHFSMVATTTKSLFPLQPLQNFTQDNLK